MQPSPSCASGAGYYVCLSERPGAGHLISGAADATEAALLFLDRWGPDAEDDEAEVRVVVADALTGERQCFAIEISTGKVESC